MKTIIIVTGLFLLATVCAENIDPYDQDAQYGWAENIGWINGEPSTSGVQVYADRVEGFVWAENIGWINLSPASYGGVLNDGDGNLSGFAWGENVGWINFDPVVAGDPTDYGVTIDSDGYASGWAWGENIGWIRFDQTQSWSLRVCIVTLEDLTNFATYWLGSDLAADLYTDGSVNMDDFAILASYWQTYCPDGWQLK